MRESKPDQRLPEKDYEHRCCLHQAAGLPQSSSPRGRVFQHSVRPLHPEKHKETRDGPT